MIVGALKRRNEYQQNGCTCEVLKSSSYYCFTKSGLTSGKPGLNDNLVVITGYQVLAPKGELPQFLNSTEERQIARNPNQEASANVS